MTYSSFWIEKLSSHVGQTDAAAETIYFTDRGLAFTVFELARWAEQKRLPIRWVDSCWVRAEVTPSILREFIIGHFENSEALLQHLDPRLDLDAQFVLVAEEF